MEGKILKGAARGGLVELTRLKEEQLRRREEELHRRCASRGSNTHHTTPQPSLIPHLTWHVDILWGYVGFAIAISGNIEQQNGSEFPKTGHMLCDQQAFRHRVPHYTRPCTALVMGKQT